MLASGASPQGRGFEPHSCHFHDLAIEQPSDHTIGMEQQHDSFAEWSKALAQGASPQGRGIEPTQVLLSACFEKIRKALPFPGIEPWTFRALSENHVTRPNSRLQVKFAVKQVPNTELLLRTKYTWPGSNWRPSACWDDIITTRPQVRCPLGRQEIECSAWPVGLMDKASAPSAGDSWFKSWARHSHRAPIYGRK